MVQGIGRDYTFEDDDWKGFYLQCIEKDKNAEIKIIAFCVMGNHVHVLLMAETIEALGKIMHKVNGDYSRYYNRINKRVGHVFRNRYRSEPIKNVDQLINCLVYLHNNPIKAGIVEKAEDYRYSSYANYLSGRGIVDFEEAAKHFNISADNIRSIMEAKSSSNFIEHDDKENEEKDKVLNELIISTVKVSVPLTNHGVAHGLCGLMVRSIGVIVSLIKTKLNTNEKLFTVIASTPKATVQAAIGGIPLAMGLASGNIILSIAVISILFTAPLGAFAMDFSVNRLVPTSPRQ